MRVKSAGCKSSKRRNVLGPTHSQATYQRALQYYIFLSVMKKMVY